MNIFRVFAVLLFMVPTMASASHILGGEITYSHISGKKYNIQTVIYRDCNGCKLMGAGGGESTQDCGNFDLFLATSQYSGCGRNNIARLTLTRTGIKEILPVCSTYKSKCNANANLPFGVEAHYFQTTIDFDNYSSYTGCAFEIYTQISWRTSDVFVILL